MPIMKGITSILFIADNAPDEQYALSRTIEMARKWRARLMVMDVLELSTLEGDVLREVHLSGNLQERLLETRKRELERMVAPFASTDIEIRIKVSVGRFHHEAIRAINRNGHKLLIKGAKGPKQQPRSIGPMDYRLIHRSPCPVMILREQPPGPVLATVSLNDRHSDARRLDDAVFRLAHNLAEMNKASLHLAHAWELPDEKILRAVSSQGDNERLRSRIEEAHSRLLSQMMAHYPEIEATPHLLEGWASYVVPKLIEELRVELLVIGASQKGATDETRLGSILEVILHQVNCSILVVKP